MSAAHPPTNQNKYKGTYKWGQWVWDGLLVGGGGKERGVPLGEGAASLRHGLNMNAYIDYMEPNSLKKDSLAWWSLYLLARVLHEALAWAV